MKLIQIILLMALCSCNEQASYWQEKKDMFKYKNIKEFISDSTLRADYKNYKSIKHPLFSNAFSINENIYLYSWQERNPQTIEFTVVYDDGELGLKIFYFILDKRGKLISFKQIAGKGLEGGYSFETRSQFIDSNTLLNIGAVTEYWDIDNQRKFEKTRGDSTFALITIDKFGKITEKIIKEKFELNLQRHNR